MLIRKTLEEKIAVLVKTEFAEILAELEEDLREYRRRLGLKKETRAALDNAEAELEKLRLARIELKKSFWEVYYENNDEAALSEIEFEHRILERAADKADKALEKARVSFERADFDEVGEGFSLRTKANIAEDEVNRRIDSLEEMLESLLTGTRYDVKEASQALRDEYEEPRFDTAAEQEAHVKRTIEILNAVTESYTPGFRRQSARKARNARERTLQAKKPRPWWLRALGRRQ